MIFARIANGEHTAAIMRSYNRSPDLFYQWIRQGGEQRNQRWQDAKTQSADALVEEGLYKIDNASTATAADVAKAKAQAEYRRWLAGVRSKEYRDTTGEQSITLNIGQELVSILRLRGAPKEHALLPLPAEIVTDEGEL